MPAIRLQILALILLAFNDNLVSVSTTGTYPCVHVPLLLQTKISDTLASALKPGIKLNDEQIALTTGKLTVDETTMQCDLTTYALTSFEISTNSKPLAVTLLQKETKKSILNIPSTEDCPGGIKVELKLKAKLELTENGKSVTVSSATLSISNDGTRKTDKGKTIKECKDQKKKIEHSVKDFNPSSLSGLLGSEDWSEIADTLRFSKTPTDKQKEIEARVIKAFASVHSAPEANNGEGLWMLFDHKSAPSYNWNVKYLAKSDIVTLSTGKDNVEMSLTIQNRQDIGNAYSYEKRLYTHANISFKMAFVAYPLGDQMEIQAYVERSQMSGFTDCVNCMGPDAIFDTRYRERMFDSSIATMIMKLVKESLKKT